MINEIWKQVDGFSDYEVSNMGRVRSFKLGKNGSILIPRKTSEKKPYPMVYIKNDEGNNKLVKIHRLVALAFVTKPIGCNIVNHIDGNKLNNVADNLEWTDNGGNNKHAYDSGLRKGPVRKFRTVIRITSENEIETYESLAAASRENDISDTSIRRACKGIAKTAGGYQWKFVD